MTAPPPLFNMAASVLAQAGARADHAALIVPGDVTLTFAQVESAVLGTATGLLRHARPGDRILMRLGNTPDFPVSYLAAIAAGLIPVPTSSQLTVAEVTHIAAEVRPRLVIQSDQVAAPEQALPSVDLATLRGWRDLPPATYDMGDPNRAAYIIYTSGTSGKQRAVVHAHRAIWARRMMWDGWYGLRADDRLMHAGAFNWTYTLGTGLMDPWSVGATAVIPAPGTDPAALPALLAQTGATIFAAAPGVYRKLLRADVPPMPHLRHGLSAGEKLPQTVADDWLTKTGTPVFEAFGMSECSTFISGSPDRPAPQGSLGFAQPGRNVALLGPEGPVVTGQTGTIAIHRDDPGLMMGYFDQPIETAAKYLGDWFLTGDEGIADESGAITYAGRADDMMNAGGIRVSPVEVEEVLINHPQITEVACAEVKVQGDLTLIAAFYCAPDVLDDADLRSFARQTLAPYKVPRLYQRVDQLPRGANNKLLRRQLRQEWEAAHGQT